MTIPCQPCLQILSQNMLLRQLLCNPDGETRASCGNKKCRLHGIGPSHFVQTLSSSMATLSRTQTQPLTDEIVCYPSTMTSQRNHVTTPYHDSTTGQSNDGSQPLQHFWVESVGKDISVGGNVWRGCWQWVEWVKCIDAVHRVQQSRNWCITLCTCYWMQ